MTDFSRKVSSRLSGFFFEPASPINLGICRFVFYGIVLLIYVKEDFSLWGAVPAAFWHPNFVFEHLHIPVFSSETLGAMGAVWLLSLLFSALGLFTRESTIAAFVIGSYLLGLTNSIAKLHHTENLLVIVMGIMAVSYCGDGFSLDRWRKSHQRTQREVLKEMKGEYTWPVRLIWTMMTLLFCAAGMSKLRNTGLEWVTSEYLSTLLVNNYLSGNRTEPLVGWLPLWIAGKPVLYHTLAGATVLFETTAPLALVNRRFRALSIPGLFCMMSGIWIVMGIPFPQLLACFIFWIPWSKWIAGPFHPPFSVFKDKPKEKVPLNPYSN